MPTAGNEPPFNCSEGMSRISARLRIAFATEGIWPEKSGPVSRPALGKEGSIAVANSDNLPRD